MEWIIIIVVISAIVGVAFAIGRVSSKLRSENPFNSTPRVPITQADIGEVVKLSGDLRYAKRTPLTAPLTGRPCAGYQVVVEELRSTGGSYLGWDTVVEEGEIIDFWIEDDTGEAFVQVDDPSVLLSLEKHFSSGTVEEITPDLKSFLAKHNIKHKGLLLEKDIHYAEGLLEQGEEIAVIGVLAKDPETNRLIVRASEEQPLLITNELKLIDG